MEEKKYKQRRSMSGPGSIMSKVITVLFTVAVVLYFTGNKIWAYVTGGVSVVLLFILLILLAVEQHQNRVLTEQQLKEKGEESRKIIEQTRR